MVLGSLGAPHASVIIAAWFMESAAKTLNPNAPQKAHVKDGVGKASKEAGCVAATLTASSINSVVQITTPTVMHKSRL